MSNGFISNAVSTIATPYAMSLISPPYVDKNAEKYGSLSLILKSTTPVSIITIRSTMIVITANGIRNLSFFIPHSAYFLRSSSVYKTGR